MSFVLQALLGAMLLGAAVGDAVPPIFTGGYPTIPATSNLGTSFKLETSLNEAGTTYYLVVPANSASPTAAQVVSGANYGAVTVITAGTIGVSAGSTIYDATVSTSLVENTEYDVYVVAKDSAGNLQTTPTLQIIKMADVSAPVYNTNYPKLTKISGPSFNIEVSMDEIGTAYYVLVPNGDPAPSAAEVVASQASGGGDPLACGYWKITSANTALATTVSSASATDPACLEGDDAFYGLDGALAGGVAGLEAKCKRCPLFSNATDYDVYVVAEDDESTAAYYRTNNLQSAATKVDLFTADITPPNYVDGYPKVVALAPFTLEVALSLQEVGKGYYMVVPFGAGAPTSAQIRSLVNSYTDPSGTIVTVKANGTIDLPTAYTEVTSPVVGLVDETQYYIYVVVEDDGNTDVTLNVYQSTAPNLQAVPNLITVTTKDGTPPSFPVTTSLGWPNPTTANVGGLVFDLVAQLDEIGRVYYVVVPAGSVPPAVGDIRGGEGNPLYPNSSAVACGSWGVESPSINYTTTVQGVENPDSDPRCQTNFYGLSGGLDGLGPLCSNCPLIASETPYDIYLVAEDDSGNLQLVYKYLSVTTTDITPPKFQSGTPVFTYNKASEYTFAPNDGGVSLGLTVQLDEPGRAYYVVVPTGSAAPSAGEVKSMPASYQGVTVVSTGYFNISSAFTSTTHEVKSLPSEVTYDIYVVAEDDEDLAALRPGQAAPVSNLQAAPAKLTELTADITPPSFSNGYPLIPNTNLGGVTGTTFQLNIKMDEPGTVYYVAVPSGFTYHEGLTDGTARSLPTPSEVRNGKGPGGEGQVVAGNIVVGTPSDGAASWDGTVTGLSSQTQYDIYIVAEDDSHSGFTAAGAVGPNLQLAVVKIDVTTRDVTPPTFSSGFPKAVVGGVAVDIVVQLNEVGKFYYVVVDAAAAAPTAAEVKAGVSYGAVTVHARCEGDTVGAAGKTVAAGSADTVCTTANIPTETSLIAYVVAEDNVDSSLTAGQADQSANMQTTATAVAFTTKDVTPPEFALSTPRVEALTGEYFELSSALNEIGTTFYTVLLKGDPAPSASEVKMGTGAGGAFAQTGDTIANAAASTEYRQIIPNNLTSEVEYTVYITAQDDETAPNLRQAVSTIRVRTPDVTPPVFVGHWTENGTVAHVGGHDFDLVVQLNEAGTVYYVVVPTGSPAPTVEEIRNSRAAYDKEPNACGYVSVNAAFANRTGSVIGVDIAKRPDCQVEFDFYGLPKENPNKGKFYGLGLGDDDEPYCSRCPLIDSETAYDVWIVAEDDGGHGIPEEAVNVDARNIQAEATKVMIINYPVPGPSVFTADVTAPEFQLMTPKTENLKGTALDIVVALDEPGVTYYVVVAASAADAGVLPSRAQVLYGADGGNVTAAAFGSITVTAPSQPFSKTVSGLLVDTAYKVYVFAEDDEPNDYITAGPYRGMTKFTTANAGKVQAAVDVTTVDTFAPKWEQGYPAVGNAVSSTGASVSTTFDVTGSMDEEGTLYYVAFTPAVAGSGLPGSSAPSSANIKACKDYLGNSALVCGSVAISAAATPATVTTTYSGLADNTLYDVYVTAEDTDGNLVGTPTKLAITTADGSAPLFKSGYPFISKITATGSTAVTAELQVKTDEPGYVKYVVIADNAVHPTKSQVAAGVDYGAVTLKTSGSIAVSAADTVYTGTATISVAGAGVVSAGNGYQLFAVTEDAGGNVGDGDVARTALLGARSVAPGFVGAPATTSLLEKTFYLSVQLPSQGNTYFVVLKSGATVPTPAQVKAKTDAFGHSAPGGEFADTSSATAGGSVVMANVFTATSTVQVLNVTRGTEYDVYFVNDDNGLQISSAVDSSTPLYSEFSRQVTKLVVTTPDNTAPLFKAGFPNFANALGTSFDLTIQIDEPGTAYYVCQSYGDLAPTVAEVKAGSGSAAASVITSGSLSMPTVNNPSQLRDHYVVSVSAGVSSGTIYECYIVAEDLASSTGVTTVNVQADPTRVTVRTPSVDSTLSGITIGGGGGLLLQPPFHPLHANYNVFVPDGTSTIDFTPTATSSQSANSIAVNGTAVTSGSNTVRTLAYGTNTFEIVVTAGDGTTKLTYYVNAVRGALSSTSNATLAILSLRQSDGSEINSTAMGGRGWPTCVRGCTTESYVGCNDVNPECIMDSAKLKYTAFVSTDMTYVDVHAVATQPSLSSIKIFTPGQPGANYPGGLPGYTSGTLLATNPRISMASLFNNSGSQMRIHVVVTAGDAISKSTYEIEVFRYGPGTYESWQPVVPTTAQPGPRFSDYYASNDLLTTYVTSSPSVTPLTIIPKLDVTAPTYLTGYPATTTAGVANTATGVRVRVQLNEPGTVYYVVVPFGTTPGPNSREVKTHHLRSDIVTYGSVTAPHSPSRDATRELQLEVTGLATTTAYDIYIVAEDDAKSLALESLPNLQAAPTKLTYTTL